MLVEILHSKKTMFYLQCVKKGILEKVLTFFWFSTRFTLPRFLESLRCSFSMGLSDRIKSCTLGFHLAFQDAFLDENDEKSTLGTLLQFFNQEIFSG